MERRVERGPAGGYPDAMTPRPTTLIVYSDDL
jgi:hypothetical protein